MNREYAALGVVILANTPLYWLIGKLLFGDLQSFLDAVVFWVKPDILSWFDGEYWEDWLAELRLAILFTAAFGLVYVEYMGVAVPCVLPALAGE